MMRRADRLFQIVQFLRGGRLTTAARLAERLEVSERTIYRDIADLQTNGVPIDGEAGIGYLMREGHDLPPLMFTRDEIVALVAGARMVQAWGGAEMGRAAEEALIKIETILPDGERERARATPIHAPIIQLSDADRARLDLLERAALASHRIEFGYQDQNQSTTQRAALPLGLLFWGKTWTLAAWCHLRHDFRTFRIDRMTDLEIKDYERPQKGCSLLDFYKAMQRRDAHSIR